MTVEAELRRRDALDNVVPWVLTSDTDNTDTARSDPVVDFGARTRLSAVISELADIAAILTNGATVNFPDDFPDTTSAATLEQIRTLLAETVKVDDDQTQDALEALQVALLSALGLLATEGTLGNIEGLLSSGIPVEGFPPEYPLPAAQVTTLTPPSAVTANQGARGESWPVETHKERSLRHANQLVTASGATELVAAPATPGKGWRLWWVEALQKPTETSYPLIEIAIGAETIYQQWAISKSQRVDGPADGAITVTLDATGQVAVSAIYEEYTP